MNHVVPLPWVWLFGTTQTGSHRNTGELWIVPCDMHIYKWERVEVAMQVHNS